MSQVSHVVCLETSCEYLRRVRLCPCEHFELVARSYLLRPMLRTTGSFCAHRTNPNFAPSSHIEDISFRAQLKNHGRARDTRGFVGVWR